MAVWMAQAEPFLIVVKVQLCAPVCFFTVRRLKESLFEGLFDLVTIA